MIARTLGALAAIALIGVLMLLLAGCATKLGLDNTASGGGSWAIQTWRCDPEKEPIGGNTGEVENTVSRGGTAGTTHP